MIDKCDYKCELLKALGHPIRLKMVKELLSENDCNVNDLAGKFQLPQSTTSQHLAILKNKGIITSKKKGVETCYKVSNETVIKILQVLEEN
ncbi:MAG: metalloregulator ArsR/SmtB family transcription factor [Spirochaetes bacterium]|nr:metalloregulator ArsR/SmtB family transcription factor [Spirochaetota bacterium]